MPTTYPKVSIMIPAYNQQQYIGQAIESALNQDYPNLEIIVSDDCSSDSTPAVIQLYASDPRIHCFRNEKNIGMGTNQMKLLSEYATGEWVVMLDGDDYFIDNQFIRSAIEGMRCHDNVVAVVSGHTIAYPDKAYSIMPAVHNTLFKGHDVFMQFPTITPAHGSIVCKRELAIKVGGYAYPLHADYAMFLRIVLHGNALFLNRNSCVWRHHAKNVSDTMTFQAYLKAKIFIEHTRQYACGFFAGKAALDRWEKRMLSWYYVGYISNTIRSLQRGLITKKGAGSDIDALAKYLFKNEKSFLLYDINILGRILFYKLFGPRIFEIAVHFAKKAKCKNRYICT